MTRAALPRCIASGALIAVFALLPWSGHADEAISAKPTFTDSEIKTILSHGPWPTRAPRDPTNRVSDKPEAIEFGTRLFFDQRLSGKGQVSCASCHVPERNWTDNLRRGIGMAELDRKTPTLVNLRGARWFSWDGAADSLWSQSLRPMLDERELAATPRHIAQLVRHEEQMACRYRKTFGTSPSAVD
ncbi:MAG TPA: cytochrome-c peroxidase, partial [Burkholderiales bacterium]|nr:cytochrome-c peroxidase [Burkholderiales bacterium]